MSDTTAKTPSKGSTLGKWTRRSFLATAGLLGGGLTLGLVVAPNRLKMSSAEAATGDQVLLNTWVKITPDNKITVLIPHSEMGQGVGTGLAQMLAEEMEADWEKVHIEDAPNDKAYVNSDLGRGYIVGEGAQIPGFVYPLLDFTFLQIAGGLVGQMTGGSTAIRLTGHHGMRRAGAAAKGMLVEAAAQAWGVPANEIMAKEGMLSHAGSGKSATFGEMASAAAAFTPSLKPQLKDPKDYTIVGQPKMRLDLAGKVNGTAAYGIDTIVPDMRYGAIMLPEIVGSKVKSIDDKSALARKGVEKIINLGDAVVVAANSYWTASQALADLKVEWEGGNTNLSSETIRADHMATLAGKRESVDSEGDFATAAGTVISADYGVPYLAHAAMEPMNCTAHVTADGCELWLGHQNFMFAGKDVATALDIGADKVTVHKKYLGGGFGRRSDMDFVVNAVLAARELGQPLKLIYSREADIRSDRFRPAVPAKLAAKIDGGKITGFQSHYIDMLSGMPDSERPFAWPYTTPNRAIERVKLDSPIPVGAWRSVDFTQMSFFYESFMDELADAATADPLAFRLAHLTDPRWRAVLEKAAAEAGWNPKPGQGRGMGIAIAKSFETIVAQVVDVSIGAGNAVKIEKVTSAVDCGRVINPDSGNAQITGSVIFALTAAAFGEISLKDGIIQQQNFPDYDMVRLAQAPRQTVHFINSGEAPGGLGEPGTPPLAPALANAIFAATGTRIRELPMSKQGFSLA
jgi:isoquinoline 1-oxidoreductase subunit beta